MNLIDVPTGGLSVPPFVKITALWLSFFLAVFSVISVAAHMTEPRHRPAKMQPDVDLHTPPLTATEAKAALLKLLQHDRPSELKHIDLKEFAQAKLTYFERSKTFSCGGISIDLHKQRFEYHYRLKDSIGICHYGYAGRFVWVDGQWIAQPPKCVLIACGKGPDP